MAIACDIRRCDRCALERKYSPPPTLSAPAPWGWEEVVAEVERLEAPIVAFGQTLFWDEPSKAILRLMLDRLAPKVVTLVGIHDSDYFSKRHGRGRTGEGFAMWANNDWTHRALWAAVGETTSLFGAEDPAAIAELQRAGVPLKHLAGRLSDDADRFLDDATEAYGWRGVAQLGPVEQIARDVTVAQAGGTLAELFEWGLNQALSLLPDTESKRASQQQATYMLDRLLAATARMQSGTVAQLYEHLIVEHYADLLGYPPENMQTTTTGDYLRFNRETCGRTRFQAVQSFLCHKVGLCARETYNDAVAGGGTYALDEFGEGAIPFDLIVPGRGRGTLRILEHEVRAEFEPEPLVIPTVERCAFIEKLGALIEDAVGPDASLCGKALVGPVMFCSEGILVLHEGASTYIPRTQLWLDRLNNSCGSIRTYPVLRLRHDAYDALAAVPVTLRLPEHLAEAFGKGELPAEEFGSRWRSVRDEQGCLLKRLRKATSLGSLLEIVTAEKGELWPSVAEELERHRETLREVGAEIDEHRERLAALRCEERRARGRRAELEEQSGELRRAEQASGAPEPRQALRTLIAVITGEIQQREQCREGIRREVAELASSERVAEARAAIARIALWAEQQRLAIARRALLTMHMELGNRRPTAWWFSVVDPSGQWFEEAVRLSEVWLEDLTVPPPEGALAGH